MVSKSLAKALYYRVWALFQKQDVAFFTYKEDFQAIMVVFGMIALINGVVNVISKYDRQAKSKK